MKQKRITIGGSDAAPILGLSPWVTPLQLYLRKIGEAPPQETTPAMAWGTKLEPVLIEQYEQITGQKVVGRQKWVEHDKHPYIVGHLDGWRHDDERVVEVKTARSGSDWGEPGTDEIPEYYQPQIQQYLLLSGSQLADVAVLIGGSDFRIYTVPADRELQDLIIEAEVEFYGRILRRDPPPPVTLKDMQDRWGKVCRSVAVQADADTITAAQLLARITAEIKVLETEEETLKALLMGVMGEADTLLQGTTPIATWKIAKASRRFDTKRFQVEQPELYEQYLQEISASRRFLLKLKGGE